MRDVFVSVLASGNTQDMCKVEFYQTTSLQLTALKRSQRQTIAKVAKTVFVVSNEIKGKTEDCAARLIKFLQLTHVTRGAAS